VRELLTSCKIWDTSHFIAINRVDAYYSFILRKCCQSYHIMCASPLQEMSLKLDLFCVPQELYNIVSLCPSKSSFTPPPPPCYQSSIYEVTSKVVCLFCFVLFVALRSTKHTLMSFVTLFITLESLRWVGVHRVGFIIFQPIVEKLLNIEQFVFHWKFL